MTVRWLLRTTLGALLAMVVATVGLAQQGYPTSYSKPQGGYGSGSAIALAAGGAAAVAVGIYMLHRHRSEQSQEATLVGCTQIDNGALVLFDEDTKTTYLLSSLSKGVGAGERLTLSGKTIRNGPGRNVFRVQKLIKDEGPCTLQATNSGETPSP
jgi:hypothetical protein